MMKGVGRMEEPWQGDEVDYEMDNWDNSISDRGSYAHPVFLLQKEKPKPTATKRPQDAKAKGKSSSSYGKIKSNPRLASRCLSTRMGSRLDDVIQLCCKIAAHKQMRLAVKNSTKGAVVVGGGAFVGGMLGGPVGIAVGGAVGGLLGSWLTSGQFRPLPQILMELPPAQKQKLYNDVINVLGSLDWTDAAQLIALVMGNATLQQQVTDALLSYVVNKFKAKVCYD